MLFSPLHAEEFLPKFAHKKGSRSLRIDLGIPWR